MRVDARLERKVRDAVSRSISKDAEGFIRRMEDLEQAGFRSVNGLALPILAASIDTLMDESTGEDRATLLTELIHQVSTGTTDWLGYTWPVSMVSKVMNYAARTSTELPVPDEDRRTAEAIVLSTTILCIAGVLPRGPRRPWNRQLDFVEDSLEAASDAGRRGADRTTEVPES